MNLIDRLTRPAPQCSNQLSPQEAANRQALADLGSHPGWQVLQDSLAAHRVELARRLERLSDWNPVAVLFKYWRIQAEIRALDRYIGAPNRVAAATNQPLHLPSMGRRKVKRG